MDTSDTIEKTSTWMRTSIILKLIITGILVLILLIPASMLKSLIYERASLQNEAINEISGKWAGEQTIIGPILSIPYTVLITKKSEVARETKYAHFLPEKLTINGDMMPLNRKRGIYKATLYEAELNIKGNFIIPALTSEQLNAEQIQYDKAFLQIGIPDMRGITKNIAINWNGTSKTAQPGLPTYDIAHSGVNIPVNVLESHASPNVPFSITLALNGSNNISFAPVGKETTVSLQSTWNSPSFDGRFLPQRHTITDKGFTAEWSVLHFNRNYPQTWLGSGYDLSESVFGLRMITAVQHYQMITRSIKYAALIIFLTFTIFFLVEITKKYRVHPVQYLMIGTSLILFYALLLSVSEQTSFTVAYILSSTATTIMLSLYTLSIVKNYVQALLVALLFTVLYGFLYLILQSEDYALLIGSTGLFFLLAIIMYTTRNVDWYNFGRQEVTGKSCLDTKHFQNS